MPGTAARPRRQSAKAPTPGSTMRSAAATSSGRLVTTIASPIAALGGGALERLGRRAQIARAVIDDDAVVIRRQPQQLPPSTPLVEGTASGRRGSIVDRLPQARAPGP